MSEIEFCTCDLCQAEMQSQEDTEKPDDDEQRRVEDYLDTAHGLWDTTEQDLINQQGVENLCSMN